ncbi:hypothetical protein ACIP66_00565 [Pseudomonas sp. NPDC088429]|uniref:hypothetical protein n=1 Tax=Pseudomonas sp. NPDC088429 TaxID=3364455 RepID=UPI00380B8ED5
MATHLMVVRGLAVTRMIVLVSPATRWGLRTTPLSSVDLAGAASPDRHGMIPASPEHQDKAVAAEVEAQRLTVRMAK